MFSRHQGRYCAENSLGFQVVELMLSSLPAPHPGSPRFAKFVDPLKYVHNRNVLLISLTS